LYNGVVNFVLTRAVRILLGIGVLAWGWYGLRVGTGEAGGGGGGCACGCAEREERRRQQADSRCSGGALEQQDLQKAIEQASNDRAALMHNLAGFLKKYPQSSHRGQITGRLWKRACSFVGFCDGDGVRGADGGA